MIHELPNPPHSDSFKGVTERPCIRCHHPLLLDEGQLSYCSVCGAPQVFLSEELQEQAAAETRQYDERPQAATSPEGTEAAAPQTLRQRILAPRQTGPWPLAVRYALLSCGIALALDLLGILAAPALFLAWLWIVSAPILTVGFYSAKARAGQLTAGFAVRLGLLTGLLVSASCAIVFTVGLLLDRYVFHSGNVDAQIASAIAQLRYNATTQYGNAAQPVLRLLGVPEFRVGLVLWMGTVTTGIYLVVSMATAGVAGLLLGRRRTV